MLCVLRSRVCSLLPLGVLPHWIVVLLISASYSYALSVSVCFLAAVKNSALLAKYPDDNSTGNDTEGE